MEERYYEMEPDDKKGGKGEEFYKEYQTVAEKRNNIKEKIEELSKRLFDLSLDLSRNEVRGEMTERQKRAYTLLSQGNVEGCLAVLDEKDIDDDLDRAEAEPERQKKV